MIAIDTNLLVYAHRSGTPQHRSSRRAIERAAADPRGWGVALPCVAEFWSVATHPSSVGGPSTPKQAQSFLDALIKADAKILVPGAQFGKRLTQLAEDLGVSGPRIFDLQIALTAFDDGATEIWTHDDGFMACPGLRVVDPL